MATMVPIGLSDAQERAFSAAADVLQIMVPNANEAIERNFESKAEITEGWRRIEQLSHEREFIELLAAAYLAWAAKHNVLTPPQRTEEK